MAEYWVNINTSYDGGGPHAGTIGDPFNCSELYARMPGSPSDIYNIKGERSGVDEFSIDAITRGWDIALNGPWRIRGTPTSLGGGHDYIVESPLGAFGAYGSYHSNGVLIGNTDISPWKPILMEGCSFYGNLTFNGYQITIKDSIIQSHSAYVSGNNVTFYNCVFGDGDKGHTYINCQFNCSLASAPAWNAVQSAFASDILSAGILSDPPNGSTGKPNPGAGSPSYTNYSTGLWGSARTGIGAMDFLEASTSLNYFNVASAGDNTSVTSTIDSSAMISRIQSVYPGDLYFDTTSEIGQVYMYYTHSAGRQQKRLIHDPVNHQASVQWSSFAQDGTWEKTKIKAFDKDGAFVYLDRSSIGTGEDLTHSDGTIYLNTL